MNAVMKPLIAEAQGKCVACDAPLPHTGRGGRPRSVLCGDAECLRVYHQLRRSRVRELALIGLRAELEGAARAIRRANRSLE